MSNGNLSGVRSRELSLPHGKSSDKIVRLTRDNQHDVANHKVHEKAQANRRTAVVRTSQGLSVNAATNTDDAIDGGVYLYVGIGLLMGFVVFALLVCILVVFYKRSSKVIENEIGLESVLVKAKKDTVSTMDKPKITTEPAASDHNLNKKMAQKKPDRPGTKMISIKSFLGDSSSSDEDDKLKSAKSSTSRFKIRRKRIRTKSPLTTDYRR